MGKVKLNKIIPKLEKEQHDFQIYDGGNAPNQPKSKGLK